MIAFRTPVSDCFVFYNSRSPNEEVQVSHQGFPYPSTDGVAGPRSTIAKNLFGRYCCRTGRFRPAHSHVTRRKTDHTECAGQRRARALNPGLKRRDKRCRMGKQFRSIDLPPFQGVRNNYFEVRIRLFLITRALFKVNERNVRASISNAIALKRI